jgi:alpha-glucosidase
VLAHYRSMLRFRKAHPALVTGDIETLDAPEGVLAFIRSGSGERLICIFNMSEKPVVYALPEGLAPKGIDAPGTISEPIDGSLSLAPFGAYIGSLP